MTRITAGDVLDKFKQVDYSCKCGEDGFEQETDLIRHILSEHHCQNKEKEAKKKD